jgi:hypothetical protein
LQSFENLASLGAKLRTLHLMDTSPLSFGEGAGVRLANFPVQGDNIVQGIAGQARNDGNTTGQARDDGSMQVFINSTQYFDNVPVSAWNFYIGGYQPAQKWLKDRRGRALNYDDIRHYQKIIAALCETGRIMEDINLILL